MDISVRTTEYQVEDRSWLGSAHGTEATRTITLDTSAFTAGTHFPDGYVPSGTVLAEITSSGLWGPYAGQTSEGQTVTISGSPTGGTFTLSFDGGTTAAIAYNAAASAVQSALEALASINPGDVVVTGSAGGPYTVTFGGQYLGENVAAMTASGAGLTGGSSPSVAVATATPGGSSASNGLQTPGGHLFSSVPMSTGGADVGAALYEHGAVVVANLPANSGYDAAARSALGSRISYR